MDSIKDIIPRVIAPLAAGKADFAGIVRQWPGTSIAAFKDGLLTVHVDCAARAVRLGQGKAKYLEALQKKNPQIKDIRFKVGRI